MVDGFEHIKRLGAQKIHETTHISKKNIELILEKRFSELNKIQLMGFISILEREYSIDLSAFKEEYLRYYGNLEASAEYVTPDHSQQERALNKGVIAAIVIVLFILAIIALNGPQKSEEAPLADINAALIEDLNAQMADVEEPEVVEEPIVVPRHLAILPKMNLWVGMIDLETYKRSQKMTEKAFELDAEKSWLIILGHGQVKVESGSEILDLSERGRVRFLYKNGELARINQEQFIVTNRGSDW